MSAYVILDLSIHDHLTEQIELKERTDKGGVLHTFDNSTSPVGATISSAVSSSVSRLDFSFLSVRLLYLRNEPKVQNSQIRTIHI
jgi:hypothetical protein